MDCIGIGLAVAAKGSDEVIPRRLAKSRLQELLDWEPDFKHARKACTHEIELSKEEADSAASQCGPRVVRFPGLGRGLELGSIQRAVG
jgi:hypothetical protein